MPTFTYTARAVNGELKTATIDAPSREEVVAQLRQLRNLGCDRAQGYYFSKPINSAAAEEYAGIVRRHEATCHGATGRLIFPGTPRDE